MRATVLIPTFDHGPLLQYPVESALEQSVGDIEIFIVGDGVPPEHRDAVEAIVRTDPRIRFFDFEKGARHGEVWRHEALEQASGEIVCYLADDDLWLPEHVEVMEELLRDADFANTLPVHAEVTGELNVYEVDLALSGYHDRFRQGQNRVPLTCAAHTMAAYRRSPGWQTTPAGIPTDLYMWQKLLRPENRARSGFRPTAINFPSPFRRGWTLDQREKELRMWRQRLLDPEQRQRIPLRVLEHQARLAAVSALERIDLEERVRTAETQLANERSRSLQEVGQISSESVQASQQASEGIQELEARIARLKEEGDSLRQRLARMTIGREAAERLVERTRAQLDTTSAKLRELERVHHEMTGTVTWRLREMVSRLPLIRSAARWVARALTRAGAR